jgi:predicted outer membrane repeat protein
MSDGSINNNEAGSVGGGVHLGPNSDAAMSGGDVTGNDAQGGGGFDFAGNGTFTMAGGRIYSNMSNNDAGGGHGGGGVQFGLNAAFDMEGGKIYSNEASYRGGGIHFAGGNAVFNMKSDAEIQGNTAYRSGGGVNFSRSGRLTMDGGTISGNAATADPQTTGDGDGGGIWLSGSAELEMLDGFITDNTASGDGGGIFAQNLSNVTTRPPAYFFGNTARAAYWLDNTPDEDYYTPNNGVEINSGYLRLERHYPHTDSVMHWQSLSDSPCEDGTRFVYLANNYDLNFKGASTPRNPGTGGSGNPDTDPDIPGRPGFGGTGGGFGNPGSGPSSPPSNLVTLDPIPVPIGDLSDGGEPLVDIGDLGVPLTAFDGEDDGLYLDDIPVPLGDMPQTGLADRAILLAVMIALSMAVAVFALVSIKKLKQKIKNSEG